MSDVAIISGGGNGIGRCVALRFARAGIAVAIADADQEGAERVASELAAVGAQARAYGADVTRAAEVKDVVARVRADFGSVDVLANLAGGTIHTKAVEDLSWAEWREVLDVNLKGTFLFCREVAPLMMEQQRGRIVNTASNYGITGCALAYALLGGQGRRHRLHQIPRPGAGALRCPGQYGSPRPHGHASGPGTSHPGIARGVEAADSPGSDRPAGGHRRRLLFPREPREHLHHRVHAQRQRRRGDELNGRGERNVANPNLAEHPLNTRTRRAS